jgi:putative SOS response-associated peptidase YedK
MGRYSLTATADAVADRFDVTPPDDYEPRYNCAPGQRLPVVRSDGSMERLRWGLIPSWADDESTAFPNARGETVREKPSFRTAFERRRCLVPMDGVYEWREEDGRRRPYRIAFADERVFAVAGIWSRYEPDTVQTGLDAFGDTGSRAGPESDDPAPIETFAVVTRAATGLRATFQDRMDVIVPPRATATWLSGDPDAAAGLLETTRDDGSLRAYPVSDRVNDPAIDGPDLVAPVGPDLDRDG